MPNEIVKEIIFPEKGTVLRRNDSQELIISINRENIKSIFIINGTSFITKNASESDLIIKSNDYYMIINKGVKEIEIKYSYNISNHQIIYDPYRYLDLERINFKPEVFKQRYEIPDGYIDILPKWYSFKFTYPNYNLIFVKPEMGLSIQTHQLRNESWEILEGTPIIINNNKVHYYVKKGQKFDIPINTYHSVINPNKDREQFVVIKESWNGNFDEEDIKRVFNPNEYK
ncbi:MAG: hypothetical protein EU540_07940 [Promethearchaeota archaeon]|nr:MAG: hypothetical protein EU540_07940 [Candidatus Lokiarchaeota archaeon]